MNHHHSIRTRQGRELWTDIPHEIDIKILNRILAIQPSNILKEQYIITKWDLCPEIQAWFIIGKSISVIHWKQWIEGTKGKKT